MAALMHVVATLWDGATPRLLVQQEAAGAALTTVPLEGPFTWDVGTRSCTGYWRDGWQPCPEAMPVGPAGQCLACFRGRGDPERQRDLPTCVFEPVCQGVPQHCVCSFGGATRPVPHVVYLAFYGGLPKVGMTRASRVRTRLTEQGADAWFVIQECADRQGARQVEEQVSALFGIPQARRASEVLGQLTRSTDWPRVEAKARQWMEDLATRFSIDPVLQRIPSPLQPLPARPHRIPAPGVHAGTWLGGKGGYLFYRPGPDPQRLGIPVLAIKRQDLMGRWVEVSDDAPPGPGR